MRQAFIGSFWAYIPYSDSGVLWALDRLGGRKSLTSKTNNYTYRLIGIQKGRVTSGKRKI